MARGCSTRRWRRGASLAELAAPFDVVSVALSKGLGCPVGSLIAGRAADMARAVRARRMFGGAMRQSGILAAAGLYALEHNIARLAEDHANARIMARARWRTRAAEIDLATVQTNIVIFRVPEPLAGCGDGGAARAGEGRAGVGVRGAHGARGDASECRCGAVPARGGSAGAGGGGLIEWRDSGA